MHRGERQCGGVKPFTDSLCLHGAKVLDKMIVVFKLTTKRSFVRPYSTVEQMAAHHCVGGMYRHRPVPNLGV